MRLLAAEPAILVAAGIDDQGASGRTVRIVLVYSETSRAASEAELLAQTLAAAPLTIGGTFADLFDGLSVTVVSGRAVVISGRLAVEQNPGAWRGLLESGDLAVLVRQR